MECGRSGWKISRIIITIIEAHCSRVLSAGESESRAQTAAYKTNTFSTFILNFFFNDSQPENLSPLDIYVFAT